MKIFTYTVQVTVPDDVRRDTVTEALNGALDEYGLGLSATTTWEVGPAIPSGGPVTVGPAEYVPAGNVLYDSHAVDDSYPRVEQQHYGYEGTETWTGDQP